MEPTKTAVIYLRVSTSKQASNGETEEGYSLPAQRESCYRKAESLGAEVVEEYVDRGESAKTADRRSFQQMVNRIKQEKDIDYVIVDKLDRFARNRRDDANIMFELQLAGARLISVKENVDDTAAGQLLHAIMAGISEFYSRNLATESLKGMTQKAQMGGTPGRAPIGYLNVTRRMEAREVRTIAVDPDRAPLIQWAFDAYATGEWTLTTLTDALVEKGLKALSNGRTKNQGPIQRSHVASMLNNRYYLGFVSFRGVEYEGKHQPLVIQATFDRVQEIMASRRRAGEKRRVHHHHLKGSVFCANCGSRLCLTNAKGKYLYFFCIGRHQKRTECMQGYLSASDVEDAVARYWRTVRLPRAMAERIEEGVRMELVRQRDRAMPEVEWASRRIVEIQMERRRLARGFTSGAVPEDLMREEQDRLEMELRNAEKTLRASTQLLENIEYPLRTAMEYISHCDDIYLRGGATVRRHMNQFMFEKLLISNGEVAGAIYKEPWSTVLTADFIERAERSAEGQDGAFSGVSSKIEHLVPREGFEPPTIGLEVHCSIQLSYRGSLERVSGIEPPSSAWKADIIATIRHPRARYDFTKIIWSG